jgi:hypothetical protein
MISPFARHFSADAEPVVTGDFWFGLFANCGTARLLVLVAMIFVCGCHKNLAAQPKPPSALTQTAVPPASHGPEAQPLPASSQVIAANTSADEIAGQLTLELRRYVAYTRSIPKNFEDFAAHDPIKFPPPPPGKKYVITGGRVILQ